MSFEGQRVVVTRPAHQAAPLALLLRSYGADVVFCPAIEIIRPSDFEPFARALQRLHEFSWVVFTSANAVEWFFAQGVPLQGQKLAVVGPATREALQERGFEADLQATDAVADALAQELVKLLGPEDRVLFPRAEQGREVLPQILREKGMEVEAVAAYSTREVADLEASVAALFAANTPNWITLLSPSAARAFLAAAGPRVRASKIASVGPVTSEAIRAAGVPVDAEARVHTSQGLVEAMLAWKP